MCGDVESQPRGIECVCICVPTPESQSQHYQDVQNLAEQPHQFDRSVGFSQTPDRTCQGYLGHLQDICNLHEILAIPYPRPSPSVELRGGQIYSGCQCIKRDGLQHDCPRTGCQGRAPCMAYPAPLCIPSGNAPLPLSETASHREVWPSGGRHPANASGGSTPTQDNYVRMGRRGYRENPPVKRQPLLPCDEHRKPRR